MTEQWVLGILAFLVYRLNYTLRNKLFVESEYCQMVQTVQRLRDQLHLHHQRSYYETADDGEPPDASDSPKFYWVLSP